MGVIYKRSWRLTKRTKINFSRDGKLGFSTGFRGFRISKNGNGTKITVGKDGVYYSKFFSKKKKRAKKELKEQEKINNVELREINPETDFEKVPTSEDHILLYLGSKTVDYIIYFLFTCVLASSIVYYFKQEMLYLIILGSLMAITLFYIFISKFNNFINDLNRSIKSFEREKYEKSFKLLNKCLKTRPKSRKALILAIFTAFKLEKYEETLQFIESYKAKNEAFEVIYFIEAICLTELGKFQEGIISIEKVYSEDDEVRFSKYKILGDCHFGLGNHDKAIFWYEKLPVRGKTIDETNVVYLYTIGNALLLTGNNKKAYQYFSKVYDYNPNYKDIKEKMNTIELAK